MAEIKILNDKKKMSFRYINYHYQKDNLSKVKSTFCYFKMKIGLRLQKKSYLNLEIGHSLPHVLGIGQ